MTTINRFLLSCLINCRLISRAFFSRATIFFFCSLPQIVEHMSQGFLAETEETGDNSRDNFCCNNNNNNINNNQMRTTLEQD